MSASACLAHAIIQARRSLNSSKSATISTQLQQNTRKSDDKQTQKSAKIHRLHTQAQYKMNDERLST